MAEGIPLAAIRLDARDEADLRWLWCESEGALGLRSSMGAFIDRLSSGMQAHKGSVPMGNTDPGGVSDNQILAVRRARRVAARLEQLPRCHQRTLEAFYGDTLPRYQAAKLASLGPIAALVLLTADRSDVGRREVYQACAAAPPVADAAKARVLLSGLKRDAEAALARACRAYKGTTS